MASPKDKDVDSQNVPEAQPAGRVEFDSRGNSVWKWAKEMIDSTSILLKRLDNKALALEPTQKVPVMGGGRAGGAGKVPAKADKARRIELGLTDPKGRDTGGGFDPYNS